MQRQRWTDEQRAEALRLLADVGPAEASRRTGIPVGTIACWGNRNGVSGATATDATKAATEARSVTIAERMSKLAEDLAKTAEAMLVGTNGYEPIDRKRNVDAVAKALETVQLLTGEATERIEQLGGGSAKEAAAAVVAELRERHLKAVS